MIEIQNNAIPLVVRTWSWSMGHQNAPIQLRYYKFTFPDMDLLKFSFLQLEFLKNDGVIAPLTTGTSIKYKVERDERYLPYIELGRWLCSHFQLETTMNFHKPITQKLYSL